MLTINKLNEMFAGHIYKSTELENTYCVVFSKGQKSYKYSASNLIELGYKLNILDESMNYVYQHGYDNQVETIKRLEQRLEKFRQGKFGLRVDKSLTPQERIVKLESQIEKEIEVLNSMVVL